MPGSFWLPTRVSERVVEAQTEQRDLVISLLRLIAPKWCPSSTALFKQRPTQRQGVYHLCPLVVDDPLPESLLDGLLLEEPLPDGLPVDEPLRDDPPLDELPEDDPLDDDFSDEDLSDEGLFPDGDAPLPDELFSIPEEAPLDDPPLPLPEASTPSALAVLSSSRPVACMPFCF
jgi:hypothetical protein